MASVLLPGTSAEDIAKIDNYTTLAQNIAKAVYNGTDIARLTQIDTDVVEAIDLEKQLSQVIAHVDTSSAAYYITVTVLYVSLIRSAACSG